MNDSVTTVAAGGSDEAGRLARRQQALEAVFGARFVQSFQSPFMVIEGHAIRCPVAIRFFKKDFSYLSKQLYLEYQYRSWRGFDPLLLERYHGTTTAKLAAIDTLLQNNSNRLLKLLEQQGHAPDLGLWPVVYTVDVPIIATQARTYLGVLSRMDRLYALSGTANLLGVIDSSQRAVVEFSAKKAVRAFRAVLQSEVVRLYREAERVMAEHQRGGKADAGMAATVQRQGQEIAAFDASMREDAEDDLTVEPVADQAGDAVVAVASDGVGEAAAGEAPLAVVTVRRARRVARPAEGLAGLVGAPAAREPVAADAVPTGLG